MTILKYRFRANTYVDSFQVSRHIPFYNTSSEMHLLDNHSKNTRGTRTIQISRNRHFPETFGPCRYLKSLFYALMQNIVINSSRRGVMEIIANLWHTPDRHGS